MAKGMGFDFMAIHEIPDNTFVCLLDIEGKERFGTVLVNYPTYLKFLPQGEDIITLIMHDVIEDVSNVGFHKNIA